MNKRPDNVDMLEKKFNEHNLWHNITPNLKAESCNDAANKRNRLGHKGIPIFDELKSNIGCYKDKEGNTQIVVLHCRGNQHLEFYEGEDANHDKNTYKVDSILSSTFERLPDEDLDKFGLKFGLVNPFIGIPDDVLQIFDKSIFEKYHSPHTMMTNAGDFEWGLEFRPDDIKKIIKNYRIEDIITNESKTNFKRHVIGILTGNGPESGLMLWQKVNENIRENLIAKNHFRGDLSFPKVLVESIPEMGLSMELELREEETKQVVVSSIENLCKRGATLIAIACNTTQYYQNEIHKICSNYEAEFISIPSVIENYLQINDIKDFDFLGIEYVADFKKWSGFKSLNKNFNVTIPSKADLDQISEIAFLQKQQGVNTKGINKLRSLIKKISETDNIIIALTEISILLASQKKNPKQKKVFIDTLSLLATELANIYVDGIYDTLHKRKPRKDYD